MAKEAEVTGTKISEGPSDDPKQWYNTAVGLAIFTGTVSFIAVLYVLWADTLRQGVLRAQVVAPIGVALFALVTFCTVVWRGLISTQQLEQQAKQLEHQAKQLEHQAQQLEHQANQLEQQRIQVQQQIRQNDANDDANLAKLLQEGARLLGDKEKEAQVLGGIVTLEILLQEPKKRFASAAMNLLADFYARAYHNKQLEPARLAARATLANGLKLGHRSTFPIEFHAPEGGEVAWEGAKGIRRQEYYGGTIRNSAVRNMKGENVYYYRVNFEYCEITDNTLYYQCNFSYCTFKTLGNLTLGDETTLTDCDFSGTDLSEIDISAFKSALRGNNNYFITGNPPRHGDVVIWSEILTERADHRSWHDDYWLREAPDL